MSARFIIESWSGDLEARSEFSVVKGEWVENKGTRFASHEHALAVARTLLSFFPICVVRLSP